MSLVQYNLLVKVLEEISMFVLSPENILEKSDLQWNKLRLRY